MTFCKIEHSDFCGNQLFLTILVFVSRWSEFVIAASNDVFRSIRFLICVTSLNSDSKTFPIDQSFFSWILDNDKFIRTIVSIFPTDVIAWLKTLLNLLSNLCRKYISVLPFFSGSEKWSKLAIRSWILFSLRLII